MHEKDVIHAFQMLFTDSNKIQLPKLDFNRKLAYLLLQLD
jgi:hypothetical protein